MKKKPAWLLAIALVTLFGFYNPSVSVAQSGFEIGVQPNISNLHIDHGSGISVHRGIGEDTEDPRQNNPVANSWVINETLFNYTDNGTFEGNAAVTFTGVWEDYEYLYFGYDEISNVQGYYTGEGTCTWYGGSQLLQCVNADADNGQLLTSIYMSVNFSDKGEINGFSTTKETLFTSFQPVDIDASLYYRTPTFSFISSDLAQASRNLGGSTSDLNQQRWVANGATELRANSKLTVDWIDTAAIQNDYMSKIGLPEAAYAHQFWHLGQVAESEYNSRGTNGFANRFVKHLFHYMETNAPYEGLAWDCLNILGDFPCFIDGAAMHGIFELYPGFFSYCGQWSENNENGYTYDQWEDRWVSDHDTFLQASVGPGMDQVEAAGELPGWFVASQKRTIPLLAKGIRLDALIYCSVFNRQPTPTQTRIDVNELYAPEINDNLPLDITTPADQFAVLPGDTIQLTVTRDSDGVDVTNDPNTTYQINPAYATYATVDSNGLVTIIKSPSPTVSYTPPLYVDVRNGTDQGMGQFAFTDVDTDGDAIVDSVEADLGLDPSAALDPTLDTDLDELTDLFEILIGTDPTLADTDMDGLTDGQELDGSTNPNDADTDDDGLSDGDEVSVHSTFPLNPDSDADGLLDGEEINTYGTSVLNPDSDFDSCIDGFEVANGSDPLSSASIPTVPCVETTITGIVLADLNDDGYGDTALEGVTLNLINTDGMPVLDSNGDIITTETGAVGTYSLTGMDPGEYIISQVQPAGFYSISEVDGGDDGDHPDNGIENSIPVTVIEGETDSGNNFLEGVVPTAISVEQMTVTPSSAVFAILVSFIIALCGASILLLRRN